MYNYTESQNLSSGLHSEFKSHEEAEAAYKKTIEELEGAASANTDENKIRLAAAYSLIGKLYENTQRAKDAEEAYKKSMKFFSNLDPEGPYSSNINIRHTIRAIHNILIRLSEGNL